MRTIQFFKSIIALFKKKDNGLKPLFLSRQSFAERLRKARQKEYSINIAVVYNDKPISYFNATVKAASRNHAAQKVSDGMTLKLISVKQIKNK